MPALLLPLKRLWCSSPVFLLTLHPQGFPLPSLVQLTRPSSAGNPVYFNHYTEKQHGRRLFLLERRQTQELYIGTLRLARDLSAVCPESSNLRTEHHEDRALTTYASHFSNISTIFIDGETFCFFFFPGCYKNLDTGVRCCGVR